MTPRRMGLLGLLVATAAIAASVWFNRTSQPAGDHAAETTQLAAKPDVAPAPADPPIPAEYVGRVACAGCHPVQTERWLGSHHDLAMQVATEKTVLGDFDNTVFTHFDESTAFSTRDGKFFVRTDGPDGQPTDYQVRYTFGVTPLQQYLIEFPGGRYQVLTICWDTRPSKEGGQRWFHLYQDDPVKITPRDPLHWTGPNFNWNYMCAECHSTNVEKNYDLKTNTYKTTWSYIDVGCQACHGPGSEHVAWARRTKDSPQKWPDDDPKGLTVKFKGSTSYTQIEHCARCHSRRQISSHDYLYGDRFMDHYSPELMLDNLYYADGQIKDEVYVYGSFIQSKKYHQGVRCTDCHNPHSNQLILKGNALCIRCHETGNPLFKTLNPKAYNTKSHHFHEMGKPGSSCVDCHMPATTYMVVDPRRDHRFVIPRPDLTERLNVPNACNQCHLDQTARWAADFIDQWYPETKKKRDEPHFAQVIEAARQLKPNADRDLVLLAKNKEMPAMIRATAVHLLYPYGNSKTLDAMVSLLKDDDPLVRATSIGGLSVLLPGRSDLRWQSEKLRWLAPALKDETRAVRIEAARVLTQVNQGFLNANQRMDFQNALNEYIRRNQAIADRSETHLNIGVMHYNLGDLRAAEVSYKTALRLDDGNIPVRFNLANLYNEMGQNENARQLLFEVIERFPDHAEACYSLGLLLAEMKQLTEAAEFLRKASELSPDRTRFHYNYALALQQLGRYEPARQAFHKAHLLNPQDSEVLHALALLYMQLQKWDNALYYAEKLHKLLPNSPLAPQLLREIQQQLNTNSKEAGKN
ncbi:MAG: tetratricopeptide repeat protein [Planctomycetes bacterium]|nr:tetratricopeptide repeat protein [Planctomycetota bacterium]